MKRDNTSEHALQQNDKSRLEQIALPGANRYDRYSCFECNCVPLLGSAEKTDSRKGHITSTSQTCSCLSGLLHLCQTMMRDNLTFSRINVAQKTHTSRISNISFQHKLSSEINVIGTEEEWLVCATLVDYGECHILCNVVALRTSIPKRLERYIIISL